MIRTILLSFVSSQPHLNPLHITENLIWDEINDFITIINADMVDSVSNSSLSAEYSRLYNKIQEEQSQVDEYIYRQHMKITLCYLSFKSLYFHAKSPNYILSHYCASPISYISIIAIDALDDCGFVEIHVLLVRPQCLERS